MTLRQGYEQVMR